MDDELGPFQVLPELEELALISQTVDLVMKASDTLGAASVMSSLTWAVIRSGVSVHDAQHLLNAWYTVIEEALADEAIEIVIDGVDVTLYPAEAGGIIRSVEEAESVAEFRSEIELMGL